MNIKIYLGRPRNYYKMILWSKVILIIYEQKKGENYFENYRIPMKSNQILQNDAKTKRVSINSLISNLLSKYVEWDRYSERFGRVMLRPQTLKLIINAIDEIKIGESGSEIGNKIPMEFLLFWFKEVNLNSFLEYLSLLCRYGGFAHYELED